MPSNAVTFGQTEVNQRKLVAIAVPRASGYYSLLVLEQRSAQKPCWRESGSAPTRIEPLLLNFNFTGICGRSMDSNGYSIRAANQDLGLKYRLSLQKQKNDVVLLGVPAGAGNSGKAIQIGRTHGLRSGFLKIDLNAGWRFTKRTYGGKTLGHIYFTRDSFPVYQLASSRGKTAAQPAKRISSGTGRPLPSSSSDGRSRYLVLVMAVNAAQQAQVRTQHPQAFRTAYQGQTVMQVGTFSDRARAESLKATLTRQKFKVLVVTKAKVRSASDKAANPFAKQGATITRIPVPSQRVPVGRARGARGTYTARGSLVRQSVLPPPPPLGKRY
jgi:hypothetical protein